MIDSDLLLENPIFASLESRQLDLLCSKATVHSYAQDEWIVHLEEDFPYLLFVCQGKINAIKESSQGRTLIVVALGRGEVFWGPSFFLPGTANPVALVATEPSQLLLWRQPDLLPILMANGPMSWELARQLVQRMLYASDFVQELAFQPVKGRLARLLLDLYGDRSGQTTARDLTLDEMAAHINTTREMVCKQLAQFAEVGAIEIQRTAFRIADRAILERTAQEEK